MLDVYLGQNQGKLTRLTVAEDGSTTTHTLKLVRAQPLALVNGDLLAFYENDELPIEVVIEDDFVEPMQTYDDDDDLATQVDVLSDLNDSGAVLDTSLTNGGDGDCTEQLDDFLAVTRQLAKNSSPVLVTDETKVTMSEDELTFVRRLGQGSCGEVSQYEWRGTQVAVKIIFRSLLHKEKNGEFEKETQILKCLRHPNVVLFMGFVSQYLNKGSLRDVLNGGEKIGWNTKIKICLDVAQGMNYLHTYTPSIIHRDLKSVNLLVDSNFNVKVSDFGLSRFSKGNEAKTFCGTLPWIAPEVFSKSGYSTKADVFSFGVVLWEILTHKQPTINYATTQLGYPELPNDCPASFGQLIKDCCAKAPEMRPNFSQIIVRLKAMFVLSPTQMAEANAQAEEQKALASLEKQVLYNWAIETREISSMKFVEKCDQYTLFTGTYKGHTVSIKQFQSGLQTFEKKELGVLGLVKSPLIPTFYGVVYNDTEYAIISEYMAGGNLLSAMKDPSTVFDWRRTVDLAIQAAKCIDTLHQFKPTILHRGISSECFVFDESKASLKISDFGLSRLNIHENLVSLGQIKGRFIYSPPELFMAKKYSSKSDVYSYSIVLWELIQRCITGAYQVPFSNIELEYDFQIIHQTSKFNKRPLIDEQKTPPAIVRLLKQCWDADPQNRPEMDRVIQSLENIKDL
eukprot:gene15358-18217_t